MRRIYIGESLAVGQVQCLGAETFHYVVRVLRCCDGEKLIVFNGDGYDYHVRLNIDSKKSASVLVDAIHENDNESPLHTILIQCLSKGERMDTVMQKSVELGVNEIYPVRSEFCAVKLEGQRLQKKMRHWQSVIVSACEQSERAIVPILHPLQALEDVIINITADVKWIFHPYEVQQQTVNNYDKPKHVALLIGPEGGLSDGEVNVSTAKGFSPRILGKRILRTETAALSALSIVQHLWGDYHV